ncbi:MAG: response regulator [Syntrophales bacterium]
MLSLLLISPDKKSFADMARALDAYDDVELNWADSGAKAVDIASKTAIDLAISDEHLGDMTGLEFATRLISLNPMINCAVASALSKEKFHEASEGMGLMPQLPLRPGVNDTEEMLKNLRTIKGLLS